MLSPLAPGLVADFASLGHAHVPSVFSPRECRAILHGLRADRKRSPLVWDKGSAAALASYAAIGRNDRIVDAVARLLGPDVVLWGASLAVRTAGQRHPWHSDVETSGADGFASVWLRLEGHGEPTSMKFVSGSHRFGATVQEREWRAGVAEKRADDADVLAWAREHDPEAAIVIPPLHDGDLLLFDGRLWHASHNANPRRPRTALLLQYARADRPVRIPKGGVRRHPATFFDVPRPPCLLVRGRSDGRAHEIHPGPPADSRSTWPVITTLIEPIALAPEGYGRTGLDSRPLLDGPSPDLRRMEVHYSILRPGGSPHPPHAHPEEEVLVVVSGRARLEVERARGAGVFERVPAERGDLAWYPAGWHHTIHNDGSEPLVYLMYKWRADETGERAPMPHALVRSLPVFEKAEREPEARPPRVLLEGPTEQLRKLHVHWTIMEPGRGYEPHADAYDVGLVLLDGAVETLGQRVEAPAFVYYAAGERHGLRNPTDAPARYLAFEFHGRHGEIHRPKVPPTPWQLWRRRQKKRLLRLLGR